ncbi:MAG: hypothetical protein WDA09_01125 [Bacteriovoracaceae bacterium]
MQVLQSIKGLDTPSTSALTAEECRRNFSLGKKLFTAFLISSSLDGDEIRDFHIFLTLILSLEKAIRAGFSYSDELRPLTLLALTRVENILNDYESPVADLFKEDLTNLKFTLENYLVEES